MPPPRGGTAFKAPHKNTMEVKKEKNFRRVGTGILYSAALASYKYWGGCEQARQYLKMAAGANPNVLLKILGNVRKPAGFINGPRTADGPEDAQDYLFISQDLWMEPDVWNWANDNPNVKAASLKFVVDLSAESEKFEWQSTNDALPAIWSRTAVLPARKMTGPGINLAECLAYKKRKAEMRAFSFAKLSPHDTPFAGTPMTDVMRVMPGI